MVAVEKYGEESTIVLEGSGRPGKVARDNIENIRLWQKTCK